MINPLLIDSLLLGVQHSFEPDHMAAVSVLASEKDKSGRTAPGRTTIDRPQMWRIIWRSSHWALGHSFTLILFACLVLLVKSALSLNIAAQVELAVGPLMIWLGIVAIRRNHRKTHEHLQPAPSTTFSRSFWVGMVHGRNGGRLHRCPDTGSQRCGHGRLDHCAAKRGYYCRHDALRLFAGFFAHQSSRPVADGDSAHQLCRGHILYCNRRLHAD